MKKIARFLLTLLFFVIIGAIVVILISSKIGVYGLHSYVVQTGSMEPNIHVGSVVFSFPGTYKPGDIITFNRAEKSITHRIISVKNNQYIVKGDANKVVDPQPVNKNDITGKDVLIVPYLGKFVDFIRTVPGFILVVALPILVYIGFEIRVIKNEFAKEVEKRVLKNLKQTENIQ
jgi:signal peptidase